MDDQKNTSAAISKQFAAARAAQEDEDPDEDPDEDGEHSAEVACVPSAYLLHIVLLCGVSDASVMILAHLLMGRRLKTGGCWEPPHKLMVGETQECLQMSLGMKERMMKRRTRTILMSQQPYQPWYRPIL